MNANKSTTIIAVNSLERNLYNFISHLQYKENIIGKHNYKS